MAIALIVGLVFVAASPKPGSGLDFYFCIVCCSLLGRKFCNQQLHKSTARDRACVCVCVFWQLFDSQKHLHQIVTSLSLLSRRRTVCTVRPISGIPALGGTSAHSATLPAWYNKASMCGCELRVCVCVFLLKTSKHGAPACVAGARDYYSIRTPLDWLCM